MTNYIRPAKTHQQLLTKQDIKDKLKDYIKVNNIINIPIGTHIRYFTIKDNKEQVFRLGGILSRIDTNARYIMLTNGKLTWSVQIEKSTFFKKMSDEELKNEIKEEIKKELLTETNINNDENEYLKKEILKLEKIVENYYNLEKKYNNLIKKNELLNNQLNKIQDEIKKKKNLK